MRLYPRSLIKDGKRIRVHNEMEEYQAGLKGYERHKNPEINLLQKGTDKEVLRVDPSKPVIEQPVIELPQIEEAPKKKAKRGK